jgi:chitinase
MGVNMMGRRFAVLGAVASVLVAGTVVLLTGSADAAVTPRVAPYVDMGSFPTPALSTLSKASGTKSYTLAFITSVGCKASWFNAFDPRSKWQLPEIKKIRAAGGDVKISFGGASGIDLAQACGSVGALAAEYQAVVKAYALRYIDMDIEGAAVADPASIDRRSKALAQVQKATGVKVSLTLPVLPSGLTADGVNVVRSARKNGVALDMVNIMAMDYYTKGNYGTFAQQAAQHTLAQVRGVYSGASMAMIGVTPMIGKNDDGNVFDLKAAQSLVTFAGKNHVGMLSFWETTRDRNACMGALYKCTNIKQKPYDFSHIFNGYHG